MSSNSALWVTSCSPSLETTTLWLLLCKMWNWSTKTDHRNHLMMSYQYCVTHMSVGLLLPTMFDIVLPTKLRRVFVICAVKFGVKIFVSICSRRFSENILLRKAGISQQKTTCSISPGTAKCLYCTFSKLLSDPCTFHQ